MHPLIFSNAIWWAGPESLPGQFCLIFDTPALKALSPQTLKNTAEKMYSTSIQVI